MSARCVLIRNDRAGGFSLIELTVGIGIMAIILVMLMPSIRTYLVDTRIRTAAQAYYDGAQMARSEALRRNGNVALTLTDSNQGWKVTAGTTDLTVKPPESANTLTVNSTVTTVTFDSQGLASAANTINFLPGSETGCIKQGGSQRCLDVIVSRGGQIRICDPSVSTAGDNRKC